MPRNFMVSKKKPAQSRLTISKLINGHSFKPSESPPVYTMSPMNKLTVRLVNTGASWAVKVSEVVTAAVNQIGFVGSSFKTGESIEFKLEQVSVWAFTVPSDLMVIVRDPSIDTAQSKISELVRIDSMAMRNSYARAGYKYPGHITSRIIHGVKDTEKELLTIQAAAGGIEVHLIINWRGSSLKFQHDQVNVVQNVRPLNSPRNMSIASDDLDMAIEDAELRLSLLELKRQKKLDSV